MKSSRLMMASYDLTFSADQAGSGWKEESKDKRQSDGQEEKKMATRMPGA